MDRQVKDLASSARQWARARATCRRIADSKSATEKEFEAAKTKLREASDKLFKAVVEFEAELKKPHKDGSKRNIDWNKMFGAIALGAQAIESAVRPKDLINATIIDTFGEEV